MDSITKKSGSFQGGFDPRRNLKGTPKKSKFEDQVDYRLFKRYGIRKSDYDKMFTEQGGVCAICGRPETKKQAHTKGGEVLVSALSVDHDHETGKVRGLVCYVCNTAVLKIIDNKTLMEKVQKYLKIRIIERE